MDKPLGKYTLEEIKQQCYYCNHPESRNDECEACKFSHICGNIPDYWDLDTKYKVTKNEMQIIAAFKELGAKDVCFYDPDRFVYFDGPEVNFGRVYKDYMPSIKSGGYKIDQFEL